MLNMQLQPVRTVLKNETNEIAVCVDKSRSGAFYTMISIFSPKVRRDLVSLIAETGLFSGNSDFLGSYTQSDTMNLVFVYRTENSLEGRESIFAQSFSKRKQIAESFLVACAETQITGAVGMLLFDSRNINISADSSIYFNYFLDFHQWQRVSGGNNKFLRKVSTMVSDILCREYQEKYGQVTAFPEELQVFYKKAYGGSFQTINNVLTSLKLLPDKLETPVTGAKRFARGIKGMVKWFLRNLTTFVILLVVLATLAFLIYQIVARTSAANTPTVYMGLDYIGDVYFGDRNE